MLLVTGGGGFVMSHLVSRWLTSDPQARVTIIDRSPMHPTLQKFLGPARSRVHWIERDVMDLSGVLDDIQSNEIEHVVHGATVTSINRQVHARAHGDPGLRGARGSISSNIDGTLEALELASKLPALKRMVYVSSGSVYADTSPAGVVLPEEGYVKPEGIYAITKYTSELFSEWAAGELDLPIVSVRLSGVFGPMDRETPSRNVTCAPNAIASAAVTGRVLRVNALRAVGDFIHADDVGDAIIALLQARTLRHTAYNVAAGETATIEDLLEFARELTPDFQWLETPETPLDVDYDPSASTGRWGAYDLDRIKSDAHWAPRELRDSFQNYLQWKQAEAR